MIYNFTISTIVYFLNFFISFGCVAITVYQFFRLTENESEDVDSLELASDLQQLQKYYWYLLVAGAVLSFFTFDLLFLFTYIVVIYLNYVWYNDKSLYFDITTICKIEVNKKHQKKLIILTGVQIVLMIIAFILTVYYAVHMVVSYVTDKLRRSIIRP